MKTQDQIIQEAYLNMLPEAVKRHEYDDFKDWSNDVKGYHVFDTKADNINYSEKNPVNHVAMDYDGKHIGEFNHKNKQGWIDGAIKL